jgi:hypothetical protein
VSGSYISVNGVFEHYYFYDLAYDLCMTSMFGFAETIDLRLGILFMML